MSICGISGAIFGRPRRRRLVLDIRAHGSCSLGRGRVLRLLGVTTSFSMHRIAWITAADLIDRHRDYALLVLLQRIHELEQDHARGGSSAELEYWCETASAVIELLRATREA